MENKWVTPLHSVGGRNGGTFVVEELTPDLAYSPVTSKRGTGTYIAKEIVYAYAMWISPAFHLKVIRAYDQLQTRGIAVAEHTMSDFLDAPFTFHEKLAQLGRDLLEAIRDKFNSSETR